MAAGPKTTGPVPRAAPQPATTDQHEIVMPPAPPGESAPDAVQKTQAVSDALVQLGEDADSKRVAEAVKAQTGIDIGPGEVAAIRTKLRERAQPPPVPSQLPHPRS